MDECLIGCGVGEGTYYVGVNGVGKFIPFMEKKLRSRSCSTSSCSRRRLLRRYRASRISLIRFFTGIQSCADWEGCAPCSKMRSCACSNYLRRWDSADRPWPAVPQPSPPNCGGFITLPLPPVRQAQGWIEASWVLMPCFCPGLRKYCTPSLLSVSWL